MPKIVSKFKPTRKGGRERKYPWDKWFATIREQTSIPDSTGYKLVYGEDFTCTLESMVNRVRRQASLAGILCSIYREIDGIVIFYRGKIPTQKRAVG